MDADAILRAIEEALVLAVGTPEEERIVQDRRLFREWLAQGQPGKCPIDVRAYSFEPSAEEKDEETGPAPDLPKKDYVERVVVDENNQETISGEMTEIVSSSDQGEGQALTSADGISLDVPGSSEMLVDQEKSEDRTDTSEQIEAQSVSEESQMVVPEVSAAVEGEETERLSDDEEEVARLAAEMEEQVLYRELERVRENIRANRWKEALSLSALIQERSHGELRAIALDLVEQARQGVQRMVSELLDRARQAQEKDEMVKAAELYREVLALDSSQEEAKQALQVIQERLNQQLSSQRWSALRAGLKERRDIKRLGEAVYDAEALDLEGRLPEEFQSLLKEAREAYDAIRLQMGEETTQMRFGDLEARKRAVDDLQARVAKGEKFVLDITLGVERAAAEVLREAQALLHQASEDTAQFELNYAEKNKTLRPRFVKRRLEEALRKPFDEHHKHQLEDKLAEIERYIQAEEQALRLREQAWQTTDQLEKLALLLQAKQVFSNVPGLNEEIDQVRLMALGVTQAAILDCLNLAEMSWRGEDFRQAWDYLTEAEKRMNAWPEQEKPSELVVLLQRVNGLRLQISQTEVAWREYQELAGRIRQQVQDPNQRGAALALFQRVTEDARFKEFRDLRLLASEVEQYKSVQEQLADAQTAHQAGDWRKVYEITERVIRSGQAGSLVDRFRVLYEEAVTELNIARAQDLLQNDDIFEANSILRKTLEEEKRRNPERAANLVQRLQSELERIDAAISATKSGMQSLFDEGLRLVDLFDYVPFKVFTNPSFALRQARVGSDGQVSNPEFRSLINRLKPEPDVPDPEPTQLMDWLRPHLLDMLERKGIQERLEALKRFRYVGGDATVFQQGWPPVAVSLRTAEARRAARLLADSLRRSLLEKIQQKHREYLGREAELSDGELMQLAEWAMLLRQANLLETEEERASGKWAEVHWGMRNALEAEAAFNWQEAVKIWQRLNEWHPGLTEVRRGLRRARIQQTINYAHFLVHNHHKGEEALALLNELHAEPQMENAWELNVAMAEVYSVLGNFEAAFGNLEQAERIVRGASDFKRQEYLDQIRERRAILESEQISYLASIDAQSKARDHDYAEALRLLNGALQNPKLKDQSQILALRSRLFNQGSAELLEKVHNELAKGSNESKILAVTYLIELQRLESLMGIPEKERRSGKQLSQLRKDLKPAAESTIRDVIDFDPSLLSLDDSIRRAGDLLSRIQTFENVADLFTDELEPLRDSLKRRAGEIAETLKRLQDIKGLWEESTKPERWEWAIKMGDFQWLELQRDVIRKTGLQFVPEARLFERRLDETRELYDWLITAITEIKKAFIVSENFEFVKRKVIETTALPDVRQNGERWQAINNQEYQEIRRMLAERMRIPDLYGNEDIIGWTSVQSQAEERERELEMWREWDRECARRLDQAAKAIEVAESYKSEPHRIRLSAWEKAKEQVLQVLDTLTYMDSKNERVVGVSNLLARSRKAKEILDEAKRRKVVVEEWINHIEIEIGALEEILQQRSFPTEREFKEAVAQRDWSRLEKLLIRAREAGAVSEEEKKRVDIYTRVLKNEQGKKKSWFKF